MNQIKITEVGPRDGLQNEKQVLPVQVRAAWIRELAECGVDEIEVGAFVSPKWVPQMADSDLVYGLVKDLQDQVELSCLVPNEQGMMAALKCGVKKIAIFTAASETFNQKNINCSIDESFARFAPVLALAQKNNVKVRGYISTAFVCPFEGPIAPEKTQNLFERFLDLGVNDISIGDTIGKAKPAQVAALLQNLSDLIQSKTVDLAMHFHDTYGLALVNVYESLKWGIRHFDAATGGLGGCPYAPGAAGNLATEDLIYFLQQSGFEAYGPKAWDLKRLTQSAHHFFKNLNKPVLSKVAQALA